MLYVLSDIHGHYSRYRSILRQIDLQKDDYLYMLGDCVDRNPFGLKILKELYLMSNATVLLGNHEYMMLDALTKASPENEYIRRWYRNGGDITHARLPHCSKAYRQEMLDIIRTLSVHLEIRCGDTDYLLVHGGPLGYRHRYDDPVRDSVWMRLDETTALPEGKTVIFGHTPTCHYQSGTPMRIYHGSDRIGVDCGCAYPEGRLACLRLDDMKEFYSEPEENDANKSEKAAV